MRGTTAPRQRGRFTIPGFIIGLFLVSHPLHVLAQDPPEDRVWYVTGFGAIGDGTTLNTAPIQEAIDACSAAGGGTVRITPGTYLSGTVLLKDNTCLYLDAGAVLLGSPNREDYPAIDRVNVKGTAAFSGGFLVYADGAQRIAIEGHGEINGNGDLFWHEEMLSPMVRKPKEWRPRALVCMVNCKFLTVRGVSLNNSPTYTLWPIGCEDVRIDGVTMKNRLDGPNTDGIDIDCCQRVTISNCNIEGGDDAIALKSDSGILGAEERHCEDIAVTNCILRSRPACGVRIGYEGDSIIRNCVFSNLTICDTDIGVDIVSILPERPDCTVTKGSRIENVLFENLTMRNVRQAFYFWMGNEKPDQEPQIHLRDVRVCNVTAECTAGSFVGSFTDKNVENIALSHVTLILTGAMEETAARTGSGVWGGHNPYAIYMHQVDGVDLSHFLVDFSRAGGFWRHAIFCEDSRNVTMDTVSVRNPSALPVTSQIGLKNAAARVHNCYAEANAPLLCAEQGSRAFVTACDPGETAEAFQADSNSTVIIAGNGN